jgi:hypothetical protein
MWYVTKKRVMFVSVYRVHYVHVNTSNMVMWLCELQYTIHRRGLQLTICVCHLWEMMLNVGLDVSSIKYRNG